jgi:hypothetical protein
MVGLMAGGLMAAMLPGVASAAQDQTNLGQCLAEAKQALKGTGIKLKVGQFDDIVLGTNGDDRQLDRPDGPTLVCGFGGSDAYSTDAGDVFVGGAGDDFMSDNDGIFLGGDGDDFIDIMRGGFFEGGPGEDTVESTSGSTCRNVEISRDGDCPEPTR